MQPIENVPAARRSAAALANEQLSDGISRDSDRLRAEGIHVQLLTPTADAVEVHYVAADEDAAGALLRRRYGERVRPIWIGPSTRAIEAYPFVSWMASAQDLRIFYRLEGDVEVVECKVREDEDAVIVSLRVSRPRGFELIPCEVTLCEATLKLARPLGERRVIDAADDKVRPSGEPWRYASGQPRNPAP
jgi:hypothetical protein